MLSESLTDKILHSKEPINSIPFIFADDDGNINMAIDEIKRISKANKVKKNNLNVELEYKRDIIANKMHEHPNNLDLNLGKLKNKIDEIEKACRECNDLSIKVDLSSFKDGEVEMRVGIYVKLNDPYPAKIQQIADLADGIVEEIEND